MGTNYYVRLNPCVTCCRHDEVHIGKQSAGWAFCFAPYKETFREWKAVLEANPEGIYDEYHQRITLADLLAKFEASKGRLWEATNPDRYKERWRTEKLSEYLDQDGYRFSMRGGFS